MMARDRMHRLGCWACGHVNDAASSLDTTEPPDDGSVSICFYCSALSVFTGQGLVVRQPTPGELDEFLADPRIQYLLASLDEYRRK